MIFNLALRELKFNGRKLGLIAFVLVIGFLGPFFTSSLKSSIADYLSNSSRRMLAADLVINSLRPFEPRESQWIDQGLKPMRRVSEVDFVTMARGRGVATLVEVNGVDSTYPIFGHFRFDGDERESDARALNGKERIAWVYPEVLAQLGLKIGDAIEIGDTSFRIKRVLRDSPGVGRTAGFAPRLYIGRRFVDETGLTQFGSQIYHRIFLQLPQGMTADAAAEKVKFALASPSVFVRTPDDSAQGFERFFRFFNMYLVAISMIVFVLSWISAFYILQVFLQDRLRNAAVFMVNGGARWKAGALSGVQVLLLMALAFLLAGLIVQGLASAVPWAIGDRLPEGFVFRVGPGIWASLSGVAFASVIAFNMPFFLRLRFTKLLALLGESSMAIERVPRAVAWLGYAPLLAVYLGLSAYLMDSWLDALRLAGGMAFAGGIGWLAGRAMFRGFFAGLRRRPGFARLVATSLTRGRFGVSLCFLSLVLVAVALNLVPHLLNSVISEVQPLEGKEVPALFLFNIPESGLSALKKFAAERRVELRFVSPMVQARLMKVNGLPTANDQFQRYPVRLSYREGRIPSESISAGRDLPAHFDPATGAEAEISVEARFAERNGFKLGDEIEFDVQSVPVKARITSLRRVQWTTFNPNFFIMFEPGVIDDAPKTWIANVNMNAAGDEPGDKPGDERKVRLQFELTRDFPDISVIDIGRTITRVLEIARSVIGPVRAAAWIAVAMSFLILIGIVSHNLKLREPEIDIEKLLGADGGMIRSLITSEYAIMALFSWLVGAAASMLIAWAVTRQVFDIRLALSWTALVASALLSVILTMIIAWLSASRVLNLRGTTRKL